MIISDTTLQIGKSFLSMALVGLLLLNRDTQIGVPRKKIQERKRCYEECLTKSESMETITLHQTDKINILKILVGYLAPV